MASLAFSMATLSASLSTSMANNGRLGSNGSLFLGKRGVRMERSARGVCAPKPFRVCMMAKREQEMVEIRVMSDEDMKNEVIDLEGELFMVKAKQALRQDYKSSEMRRMRKRIARILTVRRQRELEKGIKPRESRKIDKAWRKSMEIRPAPSLIPLLKRKETQ